MKKRDLHKYLIAVAVIYVVRDVITQLLTSSQSSSSSAFLGSREKQPLLEQEVNKKFNKKVRAGLGRDWSRETKDVCC